MKEEDLIYLAGLFDGVGNINIHIKKDQGGRIGFIFSPRIYIGLSESDSALLGMLDEYCEETETTYNASGRNKSNIQLTITGAESVYNFLMPLYDHLIRRFRESSILLHEIIPAMDEKEHLNKQGFYDLMKYVEMLRELQDTGDRSKYTQSWFAEEWEGEIEP